MAIESVAAPAAALAGNIIALPTAAALPVQNPPARRGAPPRGVVPQSRIRRARELKRQSAEKLVEELEEALSSPEFAAISGALAVGYHAALLVINDARRRAGLRAIGVPQ